MPTALVSKQFIARFGDALQRTAAGCGKSVSFLTLPDDGSDLAPAGHVVTDPTF